jgi:uncharacterized membrane protein
LVVNTRTLYALGAFSFLGFLDASFLTAEHYLGGTVPCRLGQCQTVLTSVYASVFGIPVALLGVLFYGAVFGLVFFVWETGHKKILRYLPLLSLFGFVAYLYFIFLQLFVLHAFCWYCLFSALMGISIFVTVFRAYMQGVTQGH